MSKSPFGSGPDDVNDAESVALPEELVNDVLEDTQQYTEFAEELLDHAEGIRSKARSELGGKIQTLDEDSTYETIAAVDGSFDAMDGVAVDGGLASAVSAGNGFRHEVRQFPAPPSDALQVALKGISTMLEMKVLTEDPSELLIYDGSFVSALVSANQLLARRSTDPSLSLWETVDPLIDELYGEDYLYDAISDHTIIASPKRTHSTRVLEEEFPGEEYDEVFTDQSFFSRILDPGEYYLELYSQDYTNYGRNSNFVSDAATNRVEDLYDRGFYVCLFRPERWTRAYRLEIPNTSVTSGEHEQILSTFADSIIDPQMVEPYPQWLADAMAKKIVELTDVVQNKVQTQLGSAGYGPADVNALFRGYRTENL